MPLQPCTIHTPTNQLLLLSAWSTSFENNVLSNKVIAILLKSSQTFPWNVTLTQTSPHWLLQTLNALTEGENETSPNNILKMQSGSKTDLLNQDIMLVTQTMKANPQTISLLTSILKSYNGDSPMRKMTISSSKDQHLSGTDSKFLTKKELQTEAIGAPLMELQTKKNPSKQTSNLEVTQEGTPQIQTSWSFSIDLSRKKNPSLQPLLSSSPHTLVNQPSNLTCWLEQWHRLQPLQPKLRQAV